MEDLANNDHYKICVVMCSYNGAAFIREQIISILSQTYPLHQLLIFDDASTDNTVEIIKAISAENSIIKIIENKENLGFTKNFEQAIKTASGDVIAIADQDDIWKAEKIEKMMKAWKKECPLIYCNSVIFSDKPPTHAPPPVFKQFEGTDARKIFLFNTISGHAILIKKEFVPLILPFEEDVMYDWWMAVVAAYNGGVQHYDEVLVYHRSHAKNITVNAMSSYNEPEQRYLHKKLLIRQSKKFATAKNIPTEHKKFLLQFSQLLEESLNKKFYKQLFVFLFKNRRFLFSYKKGRLNW